MKKLLITAFTAFCFSGYSQTDYEVFLITANVDPFDIIGNEEYEKYNRVSNDITEKLMPEAGVKDKAEATGEDTFEAKNLLDGNMKTCWLTSWDGKNETFEIIIDLEENTNVTNYAQLNSIYIANGWRKDLQTWKNFSRIKKASMSINEKVYAEVTFEDTYKTQSIDMDKFKLEKSKRYRIRFRILEVYKGDKSEQLGVSDIQLTGKVK